MNEVSDTLLSWTIIDSAVPLVLVSNTDVAGDANLGLKSSITYLCASTVRCTHAKVFAHKGVFM